MDAPTHTLHSMAADGSDMVCLSFHDTQEWHPSVANNGMLIYARWDYVDRDTNIAHHLWTCFPDGRDPRSFYSNYPDRRESRPWMELSCRSVPGSQQYVATASAHHGHAFGSLVLIDPEIPCLSPIPLRPRTRPPIIPKLTSQTAAGANQAVTQNSPSTATVVNVYDSDFPWPELTEIKSLRIIQVLPKTTAPSSKPRIGVGNQTNARAVLGTVPVESDGSAHFEVPPGKLIYFQALDECGLAVQSMRSGTYLHVGEQLTCQGCHEPKHRPAPIPNLTPFALKRPPSKIRPDVDGSNPFNYVRLVQPVLDRNCVDCHRKERALDLTGTVEGEYGWTRSNTNLASNYGFYYHVNNGSIRSGIHGGSRSIAGRLGARAAELMDYLDERHYGVKLSTEDLHRITLWLDCNSEFYGSYENTEAQARGEVVLPLLD